MKKIQIDQDCQFLKDKKIYKMKQYFKIDYTDYKWFKLMKKLGEDLPIKYCDCFDEYGEYTEEYYDIFTVDIYKIKEK